MLAISHGNVSRDRTVPVDPFKNLRRFSDAATQSTWLDKYSGIIDEIDVAVNRRRSVFKIIKTQSIANVWTIDLEWSGGGDTLHCLNRDFYALWGEVACEEQYIGRVLGQQVVTYLALVGQSGPDAYGFALRINIQGTQVRDVLTRTRAFISSETKRAGHAKTE
ncbi:MAG: hypothetical protein MI702_12950 [Chlorobiales bacterium]|nr:hypothetical protein [Chlorobiales bacterium]